LLTAPDFVGGKKALLKAKGLILWQILWALIPVLIFKDLALPPTKSGAVSKSQMTNGK